MALDRVGTPTGRRGTMDWQDWLIFARKCNLVQIETNKQRLNVGEDDVDVIACRAVRDPRQQGDMIAATLQVRTT